MGARLVNPSTIFTKMLCFWTTQSKQTIAEDPVFVLPRSELSLGWLLDTIMPTLVHSTSSKINLRERRIPNIPLDTDVVVLVSKIKLQLQALLVQVAMCLSHQPTLLPSKISQNGLCLRPPDLRQELRSTTSTKLMILVVDLADKL